MKLEFLGEYKWFKVLILIITSYFFCTLIKNYYIINYTPNIDFKLIDINKYWSNRSNRSNAKVLINSSIYNFEVQTEYYYIYKETGEIRFKIYYDFFLNKYISTADFYFSRLLTVVFIIVNIIIYTPNQQQRLRNWLDKKSDAFLDYINKIFP